MTSMSNRANLSPSHLIPQAWQAFKRRPWISIGMWIVYAIFSGQGGGGGQSLSNVHLGPENTIWIRGDDSVSFRYLFAGFSKFRKLFLTLLLYSLAVLGGILLLIVPGIILAIALWPAFLLVMEDDLDPVGAIKGAWALTRGYKMGIFVLTVAGLLIMIVGFLALGVGLFVAGPVVELARIGAYQEMREAAEASDRPPPRPEQDRLDRS